MHKSALMLGFPPTVGTCQRTPFSLTMSTQTRTTRWPCKFSSYCVLERAAAGQRAGQRSIFHTAAAELRATKISLKNVSKKRRKPGIWYHASTATVVRAPVASTAAKNMLGYSTRNRKLKRLEPHFQFSVTRSASKKGTETAVAFATLTGVNQGAHIYLAK